MNTIFRFQVTTGRPDGFVKIYELKSDNTLYDFHRFIQNDLDFDESQMAAFYTSTRNWDKHKQHALFDMGDGAMDEIVLAGLHEEETDHLVYTFDFFNDRSLLIEFIEEVEPERRVSYPNVAESKGVAPDQFSDKPIPAPLPVDDLKDKKKSPDDEDEDFDDEEEDEEENDFDDSGYNDDEIDAFSEAQPE